MTNLTIDRLPPGMNQMHKMHWTMLRREKHAWAVLLRKALGSTVPQYETCTVRMTRFYSRNPMDHDNLQSTGKCILDAMVSIGMIPDDSPEHLTVHVEQEKVPTVKEERTEILIHKRSTP